MSAKTKKTLKVVVDVILWIFLAFSLVMTVLSISATTGDGVPNIGGKYLLTVQSNSMSPLFEKGDIIICRELTEDEKNNLAKDDVITFFDEDMIQTYKYENILNTHRIYSLEKDAETGKLVSVKTIGDNQADRPVELQGQPDTTTRYAEDIVAVYTGVRIAGAGTLLTFLQQPTGFLLCVVLPLVLFFIYELIVVVKTAMNVKNAGKKVISASDEELIKQRAIEEYLKQQAQKEAEAKATADETKENKDETDG